MRCMDVDGRIVRFALQINIQYVFILDVRKDLPII